MNGLGESKRKLGPVRKALERLERKGVAVPAPLPGNVQVITKDTASKPTRPVEPFCLLFVYV